MRLATLNRQLAKYPARMHGERHTNYLDVSMFRLDTGVTSGVLRFLNTHRKRGGRTKRQAVYHMHKFLHKVMVSWGCGGRHVYEEEGGVLLLGMHRRKKTAIKTRMRCKNEKVQEGHQQTTKEKRGQNCLFLRRGGHRVTTYRKHTRKTNTHTH